MLLNQDIKEPEKVGVVFLMLYSGFHKSCRNARLIFFFFRERFSVPSGSGITCDLGPASPKSDTRCPGLKLEMPAPVHAPSSRLVSSSRSRRPFFRRSFFIPLSSLVVLALGFRRRLNRRLHRPDSYQSPSTTVAAWRGDATRSIPPPPSPLLTPRRLSVPW